jgi:hypothetical protein
MRASRSFAGIALLIATISCGRKETVRSYEAAGAAKVDTIVTPQGPRRVVAPAGMTPIVINVIALASKDELEVFKLNTLDPLYDGDTPFNALPEGAFEFVVKILDSPAEQQKLGLHPKSDPCYFTIDDPDHFHDRVEAARKYLSMGPDRMTIIMMHVDSSVMKVGACAYANNLVVTSDQVDRHGLAHEFGHAFGGLKHEFGGPNVLQATGTYSEPNCTRDLNNPPWTYGTAPLAGCDDAIGLYHATPACRMAGTPALDFCCVCTEYMLRHLSSMLKIPLARTASTCRVPALAPPAPTHSPGSLVTADFYSATSASIVRKQDVPDGDTQGQLIAGDFFVALTANGVVQNATALPNDPLQARAYPPGPDPVDHLVPSVLPARISLFIPATHGPAPPLKGHVIELPGFSGSSYLTPAVRSELGSKLAAQSNPP